MPVQIARKCIVLALTLCACAAEQGEVPPEPQSDASKADTRIPVEALVVRPKKVVQAIPLTGVLQPIHAVEIVAEVQGKIEAVHKTLGDPVTPADTLAHIDDNIPWSQYRQAQAQVLSAKNNIQIARRTFESDRELRAHGDISELTYEQSLLAVKTAEANHLSALARFSLAEKQFQDTRVVSPIPGRIARKYIDLGAMVTPGTPLYRVVDLSRLKVNASIPQAVISQARVGSPAELTVSALNDRTFPGRVRFLSPQADEATGAFSAEVHVKNTDVRDLRAGMTARITILLTDNRPRLVVPEHALVLKEDRPHIYRISGGRARLTPIGITKTLDARVIATAGLSEADTIVIVGLKNLGIDTPVQVETLHQTEMTNQD